MEQENKEYLVETGNASEKKTAMSAYGTEEQVTMLDEKGLGMFTGALSGRTPLGESKVVVSYQTYCLDDPNDPGRDRVYTLNNASVELSIDKHNPQFFTLDVVFLTYTDPELKFFWSRLQNFKSNIAKHPEKNWIFYVNILEKGSLSMQTDVRDVLVMANVFNPLAWYLTREVPNLLTDEIKITETVRNGGEVKKEVVDLQGGNIVRMIVADTLVQFQIRSDVDTGEIKGEVEREEEEKRYLNASKEMQPDDFF